MNRKKKSVLYVDDEEINLIVFEQTFNDRYQVFTASSGTKGLEVLTQNVALIQVVISDMKMYEMDGLEFIKNAKEIKPEIHGFILTGFTYNSEIEKAVENGLIEEAFTKPVDFNKMGEVIAKFLNT